MKIKWKTIAPLIVWLVIYLLPIPAGLNANQWHYFAVFAAVITGLVLESMPVGAVGLIGLTFAAVMGYVESDPTKSLRWALSGFSESTVWLIVGAFIFAIGYRKSGLGKRIALLLVRGLGRRTLGLGYAVTFADLILAPATPSNTARSGGTIYPIISNIPKIYGSEPGPTAGKIGTYVMWTAFAATAVTSSLFLTALAPNAAALSIAKKTVNVDLSWSQWFVGFAPLGVLLILLVPWVSYLICRPEVKESPEIVTWAAAELKAMGPLSRNEWVMSGLVVLAMFLWITGSNPNIKLPFLGANFINATMVVLVIISLLLVTKVVEFAGHHCREERLGSAFFHFTSLLTLASGLNEIGIHKSGWPRALPSHWWGCVADVGADPARHALLLIHYFFQHHVARGCRAAGGIGGGDGYPGRASPVPTLTLLCCYSLGLMGVISAVTRRARTYVLRQRLRRQGRLLEVWPHLRADLLCRPPGDRVALAADR